MIADRPLRVLLIAGSQRRLNSCPGLDSKARALMHRMAAALPFGWQIDLEDLGNEHGKPKIQPCNACVSSPMALRVWPCNCYGRIAIINLAFFGTWIFTAVWRVQTPGHSSGQSIGTGPPRTSSCFSIGSSA